MDKELELDSLGILRQTKLPTSLNWLQDCDKALLLELLFAGETGLSKAYVAKWDKKNPESSMRLSVGSLVDWGTDKRGKPAFLILTWQGEDAANLVRKVAANGTRSNRYVAGAKPAGVPA